MLEEIILKKLLIKMKKDILKDFSKSELLEKIMEESSVLSKLKMGHSISPIENPLKIKELRRKLARLKTELVKREI